MTKIKNLFKNINMSWLKVILFAIITGVYTGLVMVPKFLYGTSFQDIGISYETWILFAVIIVTNCNKPIEAMLKCFTFFLISQPLVYFVEILFGTITLDMGMYYYKTIWLPITFVTLPGGLIAYYCKKQNVIGSIILGIGNTFLTLLGLNYIINTIVAFPYHILSAIFCFVTIYIMTNSIQEKRKNKIISYITPVIFTIILIIIIKSLGLYIVSNVF